MKTAKQLRKIQEQLNVIAGRFEDRGFEAQQLIIDKIQDQLEELADDLDEL